MENRLKLSVHQLVDFLCRSGSIDDRVFNEKTMEEGSRLHLLREKQVGRYFLTEYYLKEDFFVSDMIITLDGRADGIIKRKDYYIIDEIKSTISDLEEFNDANEEWHLAQARCYAYMFSKKNNLEHIGVNITYIQQGTSNSLTREFDFEYSDLERYIFDLIERYLEFYHIIMDNSERRLSSIESLKFPYEHLRKGQAELINKVYEASTNGTRLFSEAPTGIGKTIATLYPYILSTRVEDNKIYYLTAKNSGKLSALSAIREMESKGLRYKSIVITAKEKVCLAKGANCNPEECPYAKNYYSKVKEALTLALLKEDIYDYDYLLDISKSYGLCPFEFSLDLSEYCDIVICDYNYIYDPLSHFKSLDEGETHGLLLVDEAHNLVERSKEMYSASISEESLVKCLANMKYYKTSVRRLLGRLRRLYTSLTETYKSDEEYVSFTSFDYIYTELDKFVTSYQKISKDDSKAIKKEVKDLYLEIFHFMRIYEITLSSGDTRYFFRFHPNLEISIYHLDPSSYIKETNSLFKSVTMFSATLSPHSYYLKLLGGDKDDEFLSLPSPFNSDNFKVMIASNVSIRYKNREASYQKVTDYIKAFVSGKVGNYFIYFPSYEYLFNILPLWNSEEYDTYVQDRDMNEEDKNLFLSRFNESPKRTTIGFLVIGSIFSEGIDLTYDRLIGVCVVGVGLPSLNYESNLIRNHYDELGLDGYEYAYKNPGINKVMQAMGRVIRNEDERGVGLLIDDRYNRDYPDIINTTYPNHTSVYSPKMVEAIVTDFFKKESE
ncbi:MAG: hypothetical protein LUB56_03425 [Coprobacillus sp.]|nr:hypothetical protein [Coprobacillus sp.]